MSLINQLFKSREDSHRSDGKKVDCRSCDTASIGRAEEGNGSFTYRPTGREGVKPTPVSPDREMRTLK